MGIFDGIKYRLKRKAFFKRRVKSFEVRNLESRYIWNNLEDGFYKWHNSNNLNFLKKHIHHLSAWETFWWGHKEVIRRKDMPYKHSEISFSCELKSE